MTWQQITVAAWMAIIFFQFCWRKCNQPGVTANTATVWIIGGLVELGLIACVLSAGGFW